MDDESPILKPTDRLVRGLRLIVSPLERIAACDSAANDARGLQADIAAVRRQAIYEATLVPGETGESVAARLGVSPKSVSSAITDFRRQDLELFRRSLQIYLDGLATTSVSRPELEVGQGTRDVLHAAKTVLRAHSSRALTDEADEAWGLLEEAASRARQLAVPAGVDVAQAPWDDSPSGAPVDYSHTAARLVGVMRVLNALPGIRAYCSDRRDGSDEWEIWISLLSEEPLGSVAEFGPSRLGWLAIEWVVWFLKDLSRAGYDVDWGVGSAAPFLNTPGEAMSFFAMLNVGVEHGRQITPTQFEDSLRSAWDHTGPVDVSWP